MKRHPVFFFLFLSVFLGSCKKYNDGIYLANEGLTGFEGYGYTDSFTLSTSTVREDSLRTDSLSHNLIGRINDPLFGVYGASSFFEFKLPQLGKVINTEQLDSVVLFLQFTSPTAYYGEPGSEVGFHVYELNEPMQNGARYSGSPYAYNPVPVGSYYGRFNVKDSMNVRELGKTVKGAPGISIRLRGRLAQKLFRADASVLGSQASFLNYFRGLALVPYTTPSSGKGVVAAINMLGSYSKIRIYYNDTLQSDFGVIDNARRFTTYDIVSQPADMLKQKQNATHDFDTCYIQALAGAKTKISIPYLLGLAKGNAKKISVGKAEIVVRPLAGTYDTPFGLPQRLLLLQPHPNTGLNAGIIDLAEPFYGGSYNAVKNEYRFNVTRHIQSIFSDYQLRGTDNNRGFYLVIPTDFPVAPSRMILNAVKGQPGAGIEFNMVFTEL